MTRFVTCHVCEVLIVDAEPHDCPGSPHPEPDYDEDYR